MRGCEWKSRRLDSIPGLCRFHHGRGSLSGAAGVGRTWSICRPCSTASPRRFVGPAPPAGPASPVGSAPPAAPAPPAGPLLALPLLLHPRLPHPSPRHGDRTYRASSPKRGCDGGAGEVAAAALNTARAADARRAGCGGGDVPADTSGWRDGEGGGGRSSGKEMERRSRGWRAEGGERRGAGAGLRR